jgi:aspartyl-tRNA(Asn)/glutamyl-tRNA(Gln) amidotransferase subunit A
VDRVQRAASAETNYFFDDIQPAVGDALNDAVRRLERLGAVIVPIAIPGIDGIIDSWLPIALAEAAAYHQRSFRAKADLYGEDVRFLLETAELTLATTYINTQRVRFAWKSTLRERMQEVDVIVTPTLPNSAMKVGESVSKIGSKEETVFEVLARFCAPFNMARPSRGIHSMRVRSEWASNRSSNCQQVVRGGKGAWSGPRIRE